jgi:hypothetical protein
MTMATAYSYNFDSQLTNPNYDYPVRVSGSFSVDYDTLSVYDVNVTAENFRFDSGLISQSSLPGEDILYTISFKYGPLYKYSAYLNFKTTGQQTDEFIDVNYLKAYYYNLTINPYYIYNDAHLDVMPVTSAAVCFRTGTRLGVIRDGIAAEVAVEALRAADRVVTASGRVRPIRWIGRRPVACARHPDPHAVWPVRIQAGAFGDGLPRRDLWLSPDHSVGIDDAALIPIKHLVNGATIAQMPVDEVTYWHVELDSHDLLLAEGLPAESFLDTGIRDFFTHRSGVAPVDAGHHPAAPCDFCRPLVQDGPIVAATRGRLAARAAALGWIITRDPDLHLVADGAVIRPVATGDVAEFRVPAETRELRLVSRSFSPYLRDPTTGDRRRLGIPLRGLSLRDAGGFARTVAVEDAALATGFSFVQGQAGNSWRWTDGDAVLPASLWAGARGDLSIAIALVPASHWAGDGVYAVPPRPNAVARPLAA